MLLPNIYDYLEHIYKNMVKKRTYVNESQGNTDVFERFSFVTTFLFATGNSASDGYVLRRTSSIPSCMEMIDIDSVAVLYVLCFTC